MRIKLKPAFLISLLFAFLGPIFFTRIHLFYFVPYLVICLYKHSKIGALWRALICGVILDLLSSAPIFGLSSLTYCLVSLLLYGQTRTFFEDKLSTLPLMSYLFSFLTTLTLLIFDLFCSKSISPTLRWVITDLVAMPFMDALYALLVFSLPFELIYGLKKLRVFKRQ